MTSLQVYDRQKRAEDQMKPDWAGFVAALGALFMLSGLVYWACAPGDARRYKDQPLSRMYRFTGRWLLVVGLGMLLAGLVWRSI